MDLTHDCWLRAQYSVLGSALIDPEVVSKVLSRTSAEDYTGHCRTVWQAMQQVFQTGTPVDPVTVSHALDPSYQQLLLELMEITPTAANIDYYIRICREQAQTIAARDLAQEMVSATNSEQVRTLLDKINHVLTDKPSSKVVSLRDALQDFGARHTRPVNYLHWPLAALDDQLYAEPGDLIIVGGAPSAGKTALALQCAWHWAKDHNVGFFSLETSARKLFDRQISAATGIPMDDIKHNTISTEDWDKLRAVSEDISSRKLDYISAAGMTVGDIRAMTMERKYDVIIVDYLQLIQCPGDNRTAQVTAISIGLHTLAQTLGVTVVALSQLSREAQKTKKPNASHLRDSGQIEQDADIILLLSLAEQDKTDGYRVLQIAKNKEGTQGQMLLTFDGTHQAFSPTR